MFRPQLTVVLVLALVIAGNSQIVLYVESLYPVSSMATRLNGFDTNISYALYTALALNRYSILNKSFHYFPSPPALVLDVVGVVSTVVDSNGAFQVDPVNLKYSMVTIFFERNETAHMMYFLANTDFGNDLLGHQLNPIKGLGIIGAQYRQPNVVGSDDSVSTKLTIWMAVGLFVVFCGISGLSTKRRLVNRSRGVNFNDLIGIEVELYNDAEAKMQFLS